MNQNIKCPECNSTDIADIIYGYPTVDNIFEYQKAHNVVFGGCDLDSLNPTYS